MAQAFHIDPNKLNDAINAKLEVLPIDFNPSSDWYHFAYHALKYASPLTLGIEAKKMRELRDKVLSRSQLSFLEFGILSNNIECRSEHEMQDAVRGKVFDYYDIMDEVAKIATLWNKKAQVIHKETMAEFVSRNSELLIEHSENGIQAPLGSMSVVKGEA